MFKKVTDYSKRISAQNISEQLKVYWVFRLFNYPPYYSYLKKSERRSFRFSSFDWEEFLLLVGYDYDTELEENYRVQSFRKIAAQEEKKLSQLSLGYAQCVSENLTAFSKLLGLSKDDSQILTFFAFTSASSEFEELCTDVGELSNHDLFSLLSYLLLIPVKRVKSALCQSSVLVETGILSITSRTERLQHKVDLIDGLASNICAPRFDSENLLNNFFGSTAKAELNIKNFSYLQQDNELVGRYLDNAQNRGLNVLIYGEPGTGKTQWVKAIAKRYKRKLYEISDRNEDGKPLSSRERILAYKIAQSALKKTHNSVLIFDEIEDVFPAPDLHENKTSKSWMNSLLENSLTPTFWISNNIGHIDNAYIRRFDYVIKLDSPPAEVLEKVFISALKGIGVSKKWIAFMAKQDGLVPGVIQRSSDFIKASLTTTNDIEVEAILLNVINRTLVAQGKKEITINKNTQDNYSLEYVNCDADLAQLIKGVKRSQSARLCLYGLPGTGKTAFGHYFARQLKKPLIVKKASDLLGKYVGESERNISKAFNEAKASDGVLLIDEADSFIRERSNANQSWEVSQVNEFLTQLENYDGVFIASTNLMDNIDNAAMRRFDLKIEFTALTFEGSLGLLKSMLANHGVKVDVRAAIIKKLAHLTNLTPGDFTTVERKLCFMGEPITVAAFLSALEAEDQFKKLANKECKIGFL